MDDDTQNGPVTVQALWRYPVKSMQGEACNELRIEESGVLGDRSFGVFDLASKTVISAKREGRLLDAVARLVSDELSVRLPGGQELEPGDVLDESLTRWLGRPVKLVGAEHFGAATFESPTDFERDDSPLEQWEGASGSFVDESPLHVLTTGDLDRLASERPDLHWEVRRFRPNVVVDAGVGALDGQGSGQRIKIGEVEVEITKGCTRCVMTTRPQPGGIDRELDVLRHVHNVHDSTVGLRARVVKTGLVRVGDSVSVVV